MAEKGGKFKDRRVVGQGIINMDGQDLQDKKTIRRIEDFSFEIFNPKLLYPVNPVHPC
jgi:hypothetical protein